MKTHDVLNQTPPMIGLNAYLGDPLLMQITKRFPQATRTELNRAAVSSCLATRRIWPALPIPKCRNCGRTTVRGTGSMLSTIIRPIMR